MSDTFNVDGKVYTSIKKLSGTSEYAQKRIEVFCREGKISCRFIGQNWYADEKSFYDFIKRHDVVNTLAPGSLSGVSSNTAKEKDVWNDTLFADVDKEMSKLTPVSSHKEIRSQQTLNRRKKGNPLFIQKVAVVTPVRTPSSFLSFLLITSLVFSGFFFRDSHYIASAYQTITNSIGGQIEYEASVAQDTIKTGDISMMFAQVESVNEGVFGKVQNTVAKVFKSFSISVYETVRTVISCLIPGEVGVQQVVVFDDLDEFTTPTRVVQVSGIQNGDTSNLQTQIFDLRQELTDLKSRGITLEASTIKSTLPQRAVEAVVTGDHFAFVKQQDLQIAVNDLKNDIFNLTNTVSQADKSAFRSISLTNRIDQLENITITNATITGSSFSGSVSGTISGTISGSFTGSLSDITSLAIIGSATSTATSGWDISAGCYAIDGVCTNTFLSMTDTPTSYTAGSLLFTSASGVTQDNSNLFWDDTNNRFGIGTSTPGGNLVINGTTGDNLLQVATSTDQNIFIVDDNGNLGVGTSSPTQQLSLSELLYIGGIGTSTIENNLEVLNALKVGSSSLYIDGSSIQNESGNLALQPSSGNVGIGTTTPDKKLEVSGDIKISGGDYNGLYFEDASGIVKTLLYQHASFDALVIKDIVNDADRVTFKNNGNVGIGDTSPDTLLDILSTTQHTAFTGTAVGHVNLKSTTATNDYTDFTFESSGGVPGAKIAYKQTSSGGELHFGTTNDIGLGITDTAMSINHLGNVGIGTTTPDKKLEVSGDIKISGGDYNGLYFEDASGIVKTLLFQHASLDALVIKDIVNDLPRVTFKNNGNVGIGLTGPTELLEVNGNIKLSPGAQRNIIGPGNETLGIFASPNDLTEGISFSTDGGSTTEMFIQDGGNVGIGTTTPYAQLSIHRSSEDTSYAPLFAVASSTASGTTTAFVINNSGNVGVGTTNPGARLQVYGTSATTGLLLGTATDTTNGTSLQLWNDGTNSNITSIDGGDVYQDLIFKTGNTIFQTGPGTTSEAMRITDTGNVGIGDTSPDTLLDILSTTQHTAFTGTAVGHVNLKSTTATNDYTDFTFESSGGVPGAKIAYKQTSSGGELHFGTTNDIGLGITDTAMSINHLGNVGIGTTTPSANLVINGTTGSNLFQIATSTNQSIFVVDESGNIGIGVPSPTEFLEIDGNIKLSPGAQRNIIGPDNATLGIFASPNDLTEGISFSTDGGSTTEMFIQDGGNVGIGTSSPSAKFTIHRPFSDITTSLFTVIASTTSSSTTKFIIDANGKVGIGVPSPTEFLEIDGNIKLSEGEHRSIIGPDNATLGIFASPNDLTEGISFSTDGGSTTEMFIQDGGNVGIGTSSPSAKFTIHRPFSDITTSLFTVIASTTSSSTTKFIIDANGKVGIGVPSPTEFLEIDGNIKLSEGEHRSIIGPDNATLGIFASPNDLTEGISFSTDGGSTTEMFIQDGGNVSIGTSTPVSKLSIAVSGGSDGLRIDDDLSQQIYLGYNSDLPVAGTVSSDAFGFITNNIERARFTSAGLFGIGTTTPSANLVVNGTTGSNLFQIATSTNQSIFVVDESGNVGIGTSSPLDDFHIESINPALILYDSDATTNQRNFRIINSDGETFFQGRNNTNDEDGAAGNIMVFDMSDGNVSIGTSTPVSKLSIAVSGGSDGLRIDDDLSQQIYLGYNSDLPVAGTVSSDAFGFITNNIERARFTSAGLFGIGTTTPSANLVVNGTTGSNLFQIATSTNQSIFVVDESGNVGIGTTSPYAKLSISGLPTDASATQPIFVVSTSTSATTTEVFKIAATGLTTISGKATNPEFVSYTQGPNPGVSLDGAQAVFVSGDYAYVVASQDAAMNLTIIDVSDRANPTIMASTTTVIDGGRDIVVVGKYAYIPSSHNESLAVVDVSNPSAPFFVAEERGPIPGTSLDGATAVEIAGKYAYVLTTVRDSLAVIDISDPTDPVFVAEERGPVPGTTLDNANDIVIQGKYAFVTSAGNDSIVVIDISDPTNPVYVAEEQGPVPGTTLNFPVRLAISGKHLYVTGSLDDYIAVLDISDPLDPVYVTKLQDSTLLDTVSRLAVSGNYLYSHQRKSIAVVDISDPDNPFFVAEERGPNPGTSISGGDMFISGRHMYLAGNSGDSFSIYDIGSTDVGNFFGGSGKINTLEVSEFAQFNRAIVRRGLNVGLGGIMTEGFLAVSGTSSAGTTTGSYFGGWLGIGTTTPYAQLSIHRSSEDTSYAPLFAVASSTASGTTTAFVINNSGNVGIGTTTPNYALQVAGDVAATAFINTSTREAKKNIEVVSDRSEADFLTKIKDTNVYTYNYNNEENGATQRLGLIAEEAPEEVLSPDGKGVDVYKLTTFILSGVKTLAEKISVLETAGVGISTGGVVSVQTVLDYLKTLGVDIQQGVARFAHVIAQSFTVGSVENPAGITLFDEVTGAPYCFKVVNGAQQTLAGTCADVASSGAVVNTEIGDTTPPTLTINGANPANVILNANYNDLGVIVTDNIDSNLGHSITVNGSLLGSQEEVSIDTSVAGEHSIIYSAIDNSGNSASTTRTVIITDPNVPAEEETTEEEPVVEETTASTTPEVIVEETPEEEVVEETPTEETSTEEPVVEETTEEEPVVEETTASTTPEVIVEETPEEEVATEEATSTASSTPEIN